MEFPPLESVEQFPAIQGQKAIDTLLDIINNGNEPETGVLQNHNRIGVNNALRSLLIKKASH